MDNPSAQMRASAQNADANFSLNDNGSKRHRRTQTNGNKLRRLISNNISNSGSSQIRVTQLHPTVLRNLDMMEACKMYWQKYVDFEGRSRRAEYWWAALMVFVLSLIPYINILVGLATIIPSIAVGVRRLHDINKSGWYMLLCLIPIVGPIILIIWFCQEGTIGPNQYGEDPKYIR